MYSLLTLHIRNEDLSKLWPSSSHLLAKLLSLFKNTSSIAVYDPFCAPLEALLLQKNKGLVAALPLGYPWGEDAFSFPCCLPVLGDVPRCTLGRGQDHQPHKSVCFLSRSGIVLGAVGWARLEGAGTQG